MPAAFPFAMTLAFDKSLIGQLVFVLLAVLAWVLRAAAERKAAQREAAGEDAPEKPSALERLANLMDGDDDDRALQARIDERARARRREHPEEYVETTEAAPATPAPPPMPVTSPPAPPAERSIASKPLASVGPRLDTQLAVEATPAEAPSRVRGPGAAQRRLGLDVGGGHRALRTAILWSEVLGPPRALAGPHRTPLQRRMARG